MWIHIPYECFPSSAEFTDWASESSWLYQTLEQCAMSKSELKPAKFWRRAWPINRLTQRPFLRILPASMAARGVEAWILSKVVFRARIFPSLESVPVSVASAAASGTNIAASSKKSSRSSYSLKMCPAYTQASLFSTDPKYWDTSTKFAPPRELRGRVGTLSVTSSAYTGDFSRFTESRHCSMSSAAWERWATKAKQDFSRRQKSAQAINANAYLSSDLSQAQDSNWPTARAEDAESAGNHPDATDSLTGATRNWTTPCAGDDTTTATLRQSRIDTGRTTEYLSRQAMNWGTPRVTTNSGIPHDTTGKLRGDRSRLEDQAGSWLTPHGMNGTDHTGKQGRGGEFAKQATEWQTPATGSFRSRGGDSADEMGLDQHSTQGGNLSRDTAVWSTPPHDSVGGKTPEQIAAMRERTGSGVRNLVEDVGHWGTPTSRDWKDGASANTAPTNGLLGRQVIQNWPTPDANAMNDGESRESWQARADRSKLKHNNGNGAGMPLAIACQSSPPAPEPPNSGSESSESIHGSLQPSAKKRLNVCFVLWLMGLPHHWLAPEPTVSGCAETQLWLRAQRQLLSRLLEGRE
jgi:hypothetical protein